MAPVLRKVWIFQLAREFDWWCWLCEDCVEIWKAQSWQERVKKPAPHPITCDDCGCISPPSAPPKGTPP